MFHSLSPQRVRHASGFIVQVADRETIEYLAGACKARIAVDFAPLTGLYKDTLTDWILSDGSPKKMTDAERTQVLKNIGDAVTFMGIDFEWCRSKS
jgi:hypothetical protein